MKKKYQELKLKWLIPLVRFVFRCFCLTYRFKLLGMDHFAEHQQVKGDEPVIYALTHGRMFAILYYLKKHHDHLVMMTSSSKDGRLLSGVIERLGFLIVSGSSSKGGLEALLNMKRAIDNGNSSVITIDGPRGPLFQVKPGITYLAKRTGKVIIPITFTACRAIELKSWDRFLIPLPFSTCYIQYGNPIFIDKKESEESYSQPLADSIKKMTLELDSQKSTQPRWIGVEV